MFQKNHHGGEKRVRADTLIGKLPLIEARHEKMKISKQQHREHRKADILRYLGVLKTQGQIKNS